MSYALLRERSGVRWPCNERHPEGKDQLYAELMFPTSYEECGDFGHDLETGGHTPTEKYKANDPQGKAWLKAADYMPPEEKPDDDYPFWLSTGRVVYQFHTRTKTGRSPELNAAAPEVFVEIHPDDARRLGIAEGDLLQISSRRGSVQAPARIGNVLPGHLFMPFHYGYWDEPADQPSSGPGHERPPRAANELTITAWDPVSKQPQFKFAAVRAAKARSASVVRSVSDAAAHVLDKAQELSTAALSTMHAERSRVSDYLTLLEEANRAFADAARQVAEDHAENAEIVRGTKCVGNLATKSVARLQDYLQKYGRMKNSEPRDLYRTLFARRRHGEFGLLRELHDLFLLASETYVINTAVLDAAKELRDHELLRFCVWLEEQTDRQKVWCLTQVKENAAQALVVPQ
jgi:formylmethanofuran dehydrogenase subunit D